MQEHEAERAAVLRVLEAHGIDTTALACGGQDTSTAEDGSVLEQVRACACMRGVCVCGVCIWVCVYGCVRVGGWGWGCVCGVFVGVGC